MDSKNLVKPRAFDRQSGYAWIYDFDISFAGGIYDVESDKVYSYDINEQSKNHFHPHMRVLGSYIPSQNHSLTASIYQFHTAFGLPGFRPL